MTRNHEKGNVASFSSRILRLMLLFRRFVSYYDVRWKRRYTGGVVCFSKAELRRLEAFRGHSDVAVQFCISGVVGPVKEHIPFDSTMCSAVSISVEELW